MGLDSLGLALSVELLHSRKIWNPRKSLLEVHRLYESVFLQTKGPIASTSILVR